MGSQHAGVKGVPWVSKRVPILGLTYDHVPSQTWVKDPSIVFLAATKSFLELRRLMCDWQGGQYVISERRNSLVSLKDKQTFLTFTPVPNWYTTEHMDAEERSQLMLKRVHILEENVVCFLASFCQGGDSETSQGRVSYGGR